MSSESSPSQPPPERSHAESAKAEPEPPLASEAPQTPSPSGRGPQFWLVVGGVILAGILWGYRGTPSRSPAPVLRPGAQLEAPITLVTADRNELACAMASDVQGYACAWLDASTRNPSPPPPDHLLAPYLTTTGQLYLVAGLFEQPAVSQRYERERPEGRKREELRRFTAECKLTLIAEAPEVRLQFSPSSPWSEVMRVWIGVPECR